MTKEELSEIESYWRRRATIQFGLDGYVRGEAEDVAAIIRALRAAWAEIEMLKTERDEAQNLAKPQAGKSDRLVRTALPTTNVEPPPWNGPRWP